MKLAGGGASSPAFGFLQFLAIVVTVLALVPAGAHVLEMPAKLALGKDAYFVAQGLYRGWALFGIPYIGAVFVDVGLALLSRGRRRWLALLAAIATALGLAAFFLWTFPGNAATSNWTRMTDDWERLRQAWEFGHALSAAGLSIAFLALVWHAVARP